MENLFYNFTEIIDKYFILMHLHNSVKLDLCKLSLNIITHIFMTVISLVNSKKLRQTNTV